MMFTQSVRAKLLGVVLLLSGVAAVLSLIGWNRIGSINDRLAYIVDYRSEAEVQATRVRVYMTAVHRYEKDILLADTPEEFASHSQAMAATERTMFNALDQLEQVADEQGLRHIASFREEYRRFGAVSARVVDLARQDTDGRAARLSATRSEEMYRRAAQVIDQIAEENQANAERLLAELQSGANETQRNMLEQVSQASTAVARSERIVQDVIRLLRTEKNYVLSSDPAEMDEFGREIERLLTSVQERTEQLRPLLNDDARARLNEFTNTMNEWVAVNREIRQLSREATRAVAADLSAGEGRDIFERAEAEMESIMRLSEDAMEAEKEAADRAYAQAILLMITAAVTGIASAVIFAMLIINKIVKTLTAVVERMRSVAAGDLTGDPIPVTTKDEIGQLAEATNEMQQGLREIVSSINSNSEQVSAAATEVAATSEQMATSTEHQRSQLTQVAAAIEEMAATVTEVSGRTGEVSRQSTEAGNQATEGGSIVRRTVEEMGQIASQVESTAAAVGTLSEKAVQIGEILTVINDIADQTNLLALNAAIEAARAGEHGRGFAVVADEVRKLAERTQEATQEVSKSIGEIQNSTGEATEMMGASKERVSSGVELAQQAGHSLESIVQGSTTVAQSIDSIAAAVEEQSATSAEIARSIEAISCSADESTQGANQAAAAATQLSGNAEALRELVTRFKV
ncbi:MAG: methyl-accepting chemotaxis protein [Phycisphaerales bacterium]|nr:methyl-accepting chemotaxis protein [Planctomycetota bacterium]MCH8509327.1 methyl-accepting chemotaxis protein [Phycisphaerales bacterium]